MHATLEGTAMTQHTINRGLKIFGEAGTHAVLQELKHLHDQKVMEPNTFHDILCKERRDSLRYLMFLKEKRTGIIKGRGCANGRKQRDYLTKEDTSSPTVAIELVLLSCTIDAKERSDVATVDIPGAFMQTDMEDTVHTRSEILPKVHTGQERKTRHVCTTQKGAVRDATGVTAVLKRPFGKPTQMGIQSQPLRLVRRKQNNRR
jgi:hypothetical protein